MGVSRFSIDDVCHDTRRRDPALPNANLLFAGLANPTGLTEKDATFNRRDVIREICEQVPAGADIGDIVRLADDFLVSRDVVPLGQVDGECIRRADGKTAPARVDDQRFTTEEMLATERRVLAVAAARLAAGVGVAARGELDSAIGRRPTLSDEQRQMVEFNCHDSIAATMARPLPTRTSRNSAAGGTVPRMSRAH